MNTTTVPSVIDIVNKIPLDLYFGEIPDRQQVLKYLDYLFTNVPESRQIDQDKLIREVISRELRIVTLKIIEPEILLVVALDKVSLADLSLASGDLVRKVIAQNPDKYDLDIMQRVIAQIMTKLSRDIRDRITGKHKLQVFQLVANQLKMDPKLVEKFAGYDPSLNTPITMELDKNDYNTLNKKYLQNLYDNQKKQPYISSNSLEYGALAAEIALAQPTGPSTNTSSQVLKAQYIDKNPDLMVGANDKKLYYFDSSSGTMSEFPVSGSNQTPVSMQDMKDILASQKIKESEIQGMINSINATIPAVTVPSTTNSNITIPESYFSQLENFFKDMVSSPTTTQPEITNTVSNIPAPTVAPSNEPVPPEFLKKLYKLKHGAGSTGQSGQSGQSGDGYMQMMAGITGSDVTMSGGNVSDGSTSSAASYPGLYSTKSASDYYKYFASQTGEYQDYTENDALPIFEVKNPETTYAAFSGPSAKKSSSSTDTVFRPKSDNEIYKENLFKMLNSTYEHNPPAATTATASASASGFANIAANSQEVANTIAHEKVKTKINNDNKNVEKIAIGFITVLILIFLIAVIFYAKNNSK